MDDMQKARRQFAERLRRALGSRSQEWLAEQVGVEQATVSKWLLGENWPRVERIPAIERAAGIPAGELVALRLGSETPPADPDREQTARELLGYVDEVKRLLDRLERASAGCDERSDDDGHSVPSGR